MYVTLEELIALVTAVVLIVDVVTRHHDSHHGDKKN